MEGFHPAAAMKVPPGRSHAECEELVLRFLSTLSWVEERGFTVDGDGRSGAGASRSRATPLAACVLNRQFDIRRQAKRTDLLQHFHVFSPPPRLSLDVRLGWQETRKRVFELRRPVTVPLAHSLGASILLAAAVISLVQFAIRVRISLNELYGFVDKYGLSVVVYALVGGTSALVEWFSFLMLQRKIHAIAAACIAFVIATSINYILSRRTAFKSTLPWQQEIAKVFALSAVAFAGNLGSFTLLYAMGVDMLLAKILGTGVGFILNYAFRQFAVFSHEPRFKPIFRSKNVARWLTI